VHDNDRLELWKHIRLESFTKGHSRMNVPGAGRNLAPDAWTADGEGALPELSPCPHDRSCVGCRGTELPASRFFSVEFGYIAEITVNQ